MTEFDDLSLEISLILAYMIIISNLDLMLS